MRYFLNFYCFLIKANVKTYLSLNAKDNHKPRINLRQNALNNSYRS